MPAVAAPLPARYSAPDRFPAPLPNAPESMLAEYWRTLVRHRLLILTFACIGILLSQLLNLNTLPVYRTRTSLDIRNLNSDFLNMHSVSATGTDDVGGADTNLQTQIRLLQSDTLLGHVSDHLIDEPHPAFIERQDLLSRLLVATHLRKSEPLPYAALVADALGRIKVKPLGVTRLVEITCDSWDARFSARLCNTLTRTFEEQDQLARESDADKTQVFLTQQLADVKVRAEESQKKLEQAVGGNGLMLSQTTTSPGEERLRSLQDEYVKAQADRMKEEADSGIAQTADPGTLPGVQDNPAHRAYQLRLEELRGQLANLIPTFTEENPKVKHVRSQIAEAEAGLAATQNASTARQSNEYAAARHREELLNIAMRSQQASVSSDLQKAAQVSLLRREVDSEQQLYLTLLQRAKEAGFASAMKAATIRVVDAAKPPPVAFSPQRKLAGGAGMVLGALIGLGFSFYKERNNKVFRGPGEVSRFLHLQELGVIPASTRLPRKPAAALGQLATGTLQNGEAIALTRWTEDFSIAAEAYRNATLSILLADSSKRARTYIVSSPSASEGKTTITSNLGVALAKSKLRVVLIDGDMRRPALHQSFGVENHFGLRNILRGDVDLETIPTEVLTTATSMPNIAIVPAGEGKDDVVELLHSPHLGALLARLSRDFDIVLIDTPPVLHMADARILAAHSDGAILVFRAARTTRDQASSARDLFDHDGVRLVGTILNDFNPSREGQAGYYKSYYQYSQAGGSR